MSGPRVMRRTILVLTVAIAAVLPALGEIGVIRDVSRLDPATPYVQTIVDEPDPLGVGRWTRLSPLGDTRRFVLNADGDLRGDGPPSIAYDPTSEITFVAWSSVDPLGVEKIVVSRFVGDAWTAPRRTNVSTGRQLAPALAIDNDGAVHVVYGEIRSASEAIYHQVLIGSDGEWSAPVRISPPGQAASRPHAAVHNGALHVVFEIRPDEANPSSVVVSLATTSIDGIDSQPVALSSHEGPLWPQVHSAGGTLWIDWIDFTSGDPFIGEMAWTKALDSGNWDAVRYEPFYGEEELEYRVRGWIGTQAALPAVSPTPRTVDAP